MKLPLIEVRSTTQTTTVIVQEENAHNDAPAAGPQRNRLLKCGRTTVSSLTLWTIESLLQFTNQAPVEILVTTNRSVPKAGCLR